MPRALLVGAVGAYTCTGPRGQGRLTGGKLRTTCWSRTSPLALSHKSCVVAALIARVKTCSDFRLPSHVSHSRTERALYITSISARRRRRSGAGPARAVQLPCTAWRDRMRDMKDRNVQALSSRLRCVARRSPGDLHCACVHVLDLGPRVRSFRALCGRIQVSRNTWPLSTPRTEY